MLNIDRNEDRVNRHKITQEDFTPEKIVNNLLSNVSEETFKDFSKTFLDTSCGTGNILLGIFSIRLGYCNNVDDAINALKTIYGIELMADNVEECRKRMFDKMVEYYPIVEQDDTIK